MKTILFLLIAISCFNLYAEPTCSKKGTKVIYTNGVNTTLKSAKAALSTIINLNLDSEIDKGPKKVTYAVEYNYNETLAKDFLEAAVQRFPQSFLDGLKISKWEAFSRLKAGDLTQLSPIILNSLVEKMLEDTKNYIQNRANIPRYQSNLIAVKESYKKTLESGLRVFAISHSQGGLFMNEAYEILDYPDKDKFFAGYQIASPVLDDPINLFDYSTHDKDRLINFVRLTLGALPANMATPLFVDNTFNSLGDYFDFILNHGITTTYLYDDVLKPQILAKIISTAGLLKSNCDEAFGCGGKPGRLVNNTAFVAETATLEEGAAISGNVEICDKSIVRSGAQISVLNGQAKISGKSEVLPHTFVSIQSGILNISGSTVEGNFASRTGVDPNKAIINITGSDVFGSIYCESILFDTGSCAVNINGSTITNAQAGVVARAPMKRAEINITGSTISGLVSSDALFSDSILNLLGVNVCSGSYYSAFNGVINTNIDTVCVLPPPPVLP